MKFFDKMKDFEDIYQNLYLEYNEEFKKEKRKNKNRKLKYTIMIFLIIPIVFYIMIMIIENLYNLEDMKDIYKIIAFMYVFFIIVLIGVFGGFSRMDYELYNKRFKEKIIKAFIKSWNKELNYEYREGVSQREFIDAEFENSATFKSEDKISGITEDGYKINISEVYTEDTQKIKEGNIVPITIFHGLFAAIETNQQISDTIKIRKETMKIFDSDDKIEIDSGEFEKTYNLYSKNKIFAMQIFTADVLQMFIDFKEFTPEVTIKNNKIYIRFQTGKVFDTKLSENPLDYEALKKYYYIIGFVLEFVKEIQKNVSMLIKFERYIQ